MQVISGYDLYKNKNVALAKNKFPYTSGYFQPLQMLPDKDKTYDWAVQYMCWAEWQGLQQIKTRANWMMKNYKMAVGIVERSDYIKEDSEYADMIQAMEQQSGTPLEAMELKNYGMADTAVRVVVDEFSKRNSHMSFDDESPMANSEMLEEKKKEVEEVLLAQLALRQRMKMIQMGLAEDSEEGQEMMNPETLKTLPEIQGFYDKSYRNIYQQWAQIQMQVDNKRFALSEMERKQFRNMLITDREFWHFRMMESDYEVEMWNPPQVFYRKSPGSPYISNAVRVGYVEYVTIPDIIDMDGYKMTEDQILTLNNIYAARGSAYALDGTMAENQWNPNQSYNWNRTGPGLGMRQVMSVLDSTMGVNNYSGDVIRQITDESEDSYNIGGEYLVRRTTIYWKTQRKYYHLTKIDELGNQIQEIVTGDYKVVTKPLYNTDQYKEKTKESLIYGEHLDPYWANEVWGGVRIGTNIPSIGWVGGTNMFEPIYLGINGGTPSRLPFQFKGDKSIYGCKLPVEGAIFTDHNTKSRAFIDNLKPYQIGYNMSMNMLQDTMVNDLGVLMQLDPNALVKHSLGDDYGPDALQSTITVARDLSIIQAYGAGRGANGEIIGQHPIQRLDLSQTERLMGLAKLADFFLTAGLNSIGLNPQRLGTPIEREETATAAKQQLTAAYSHTEYLFTQHCDDLMPRVHQMRTDLAQYYHSTNPSLRLQYLTDDQTVAWFEINGTELLGRDFNVRCNTKVNARNMLLQIQQLLLTNNTSGANLYDLVRGMQISTVTEMNQFMKELERKEQDKREREMQAEQEAAQAEQQLQRELHEDKQAHEKELKEMEIQADIYKSEINAAAKAATADPSAAGVEAYEKGLDRVEGQQNFRETMNMERQKNLTQTRIEQQKLQVRQQEIVAENARTKQMAQAQKIKDKVKAKNDKNKQTKK